MQGIPERNVYNPAFQSPYDLYIDLPVMPNFQLGVGNNSLIFNDVIFSKNDTTMTFLHPSAMKERNNFYKALHNTTRINTDFALNVLGFGFRSGKSYFTFGISQKIDAGIYLPKDIFNLLLFGTGESTKFDLSKLGVNVTAYMEVGLGYSRPINDKLTVGGKLKYLIGEANIQTKIKKFELNAGLDKWVVNGSGTINASLPEIVDREKLFKQASNDPDKEVLDFENIGNAINDDFDFNDLKIGNLFQNYGFGIDLGATYQLLPQLQLSAAITDLGFINWNNNTINTSIAQEYTFEGVEYILGESEDEISDRLGEEFEKFNDLFINDNEKGAKGKAYTTFLSTRLNLGAEYNILNDKIGFGLLSSTLFTNKSAFMDLTASANFRPANWIQPTVSYSILDGKFNTIGFGAQLKVGMFNMYIAIDKIPLSFTSDYIPTHLTGTNVQMGMVWAFGDSRSWKNKDDDGDGIKNKKDKCPYTPVGFWVDVYGCPLDDDKDGVFNDVDSCPDTPAGVPVDQWGCPFDEDMDGVLDYLDNCPNTPEGVQVDSNGCPLDTDGDGIPDYLDKCPGTPAEAYGFIDENGCPKDTDEDGVPDYLDKCPEIKGTLENNGCPVVKENPEYRLIINGHTDNVGKPEKNLILSETRAKAVKNYLIKKGIASSRLTAKGYGDTQPVA
jgi:hypothetical protein